MSKKRSNRKRKGQTEHKQVDFITPSGAVVKVDEGMVDILTLLNSAGVRTQFSCQGGVFSAYVLADALSFEPVLHKLRKQHRKGFFFSGAQAAADKFSKGQHEVEVGHFRDRGQNHAYNQKLSWGDGRGRQGYAIERSFSLHYGARITLRWNKADTNDVYVMFYEALA